MLVISLVSLSNIESVSASTVVYETSFEQPNFELGVITTENGQTGPDNWVPNRTFGEIEITDNNPRTGNQALLLRPSDANPDQINVNFTRFRRLSLLETSDPNSSKVRVEADVRLDGVDTGEGIDADIISGNLNSGFYSPDLTYSVYLAGMILSSNGNIYAFGGAGAAPETQYSFETPVNLGEYYNLAIETDFNNRTNEFFVNNQSIGQLPFPVSIPAERLPLFEPENIADQVIYADLNGVDLPGLGFPAPSGYSAGDYDIYFDNASITIESEIPEPSTLLASFCLGSFLWRCKKRKFLK